ncbi:hypothetical protein [Ruminococcus flavefaciens]|uniref:Uncharacterized protein n=1 Tax=Ruminococcus flavefaciens TaxID=1265 RepID=A0A1M7IDA3_RUMFL|nr:hypothetical protein [Ruminococcus flavefaciens]SHM38806.1 hypothetical protein SAMN04487860_10457 [Ruminococcus flavefaciens]
MLRFKEWTFSSNDSDIKHKVTDIRLYSDDNEKIEIEFKPVRIYSQTDSTMQWEDWNFYDSIYIYKTDYEKLILSSIRPLFPVTDPDPNGFGVQECFDLTSINFFGKDDWKKLIDNLAECIETSAEEEKEFYNAVIKYLTYFMEQSDWFCIEGNL